MWGLASVLAALICLTSVADAQRGACTTQTFGLPVVDMCEGGSWTLGRVYISVSSSTMGDNSRCTCTLRGKTPTQNTRTFLILQVRGSSNTHCETGHSTTVAWPPAADGSGGGSGTFKCSSAGTTQIESPNSTNDVTLTQLRSDSSAEFNYCLFLQPSDWTANNIELTCQSEEGSSTFASTASSLSSSTVTTASDELSRSSPLSSTSSVSSSTTHTTAESEVTEDVINTSESTESACEALGYSRQPASPSIPAALVAVAVVGWLLVLVLVLAVLVLLLCLRLRRQPKSSSASGTDNSAYTSLSDVTRSYPRADPNYSVIQSEGSSSQPGGSDAAGSRGVYEAVEGDNSAVGRQGGERGREAASGTYYNA